MANTNWQRKDISIHYLDEVRGAIPFGAVQAQLMLQIVDYFNANPKKIIDLGCGNGFLAEILLKSYPEAIAILIDHSEPMIENARINMKDYLERCEMINGDFSESLTEYADRGTVDCIVSGYAIHHLSNEQKRILYSEIFDILAQGGIFINIEHVASATPKIENYMMNFLLTI
ncbi:class I SAM-dependent methyltransferase [Lysinibacillus macroides]|uniref:class I SAM-dependent methyltransferase n=1 Tax=Lysinibacillus macroides TaxID=33935 RepID=UPI0006B46DEA|nr:class I SAM-dependent methyltransferase [Lysinibacillus macroides]